MNSARLPAAGARIQVERVFTQADFDLFARLSGDNNPIHVDPHFSATTRFGRTVAHGMLLYSALWSVIGTRFPMVRQIEQQLMFPAPTYAEDPMLLEIQVNGYPTANRCALSMRVRRTMDDVITLEGTTLIELDEAGL